jgi:cathepsin L
MKSILVIALFLTVAFALDEQEYQLSFINWMKINSKSYDHEVFRTKFTTFKANLDFITAHNANPSNHRVALNKFADLSATEFAAIYNGFRMPKEVLNNVPIIGASAEALPDSKDWRTAGAVTGVKNQGQCGSCWAFSTTGSVEACHQLATSSLVSLSEKNLMDCSWDEGNQGCNGGLMTSAMQYIIDNGGIDTESSYPYSPVSSQDCKYSKSTKGSTESAFSNVQSGSESALQNSVNKAPTSVAIDASHSSFQFYSSGVYFEPSCSASQLDHGVLGVGWGVDSSKDYWIVKNSWGTDWGTEGYIWMSRNRNNNCGIATMATLPTGCGN